MANQPCEAHRMLSTSVRLTSRGWENAFIVFELDPPAPEAYEYLVRNLVL